MSVTRRELGLLAAGGVLDVACASSTDVACASTNAVLVAKAAGPPLHTLARCPVVPHGVETLSSFDGMHSATADVYHPQDVESLRQLLDFIPLERRVTMRGGGQSMDAQALSKDIVIKLDHPNFTRIETPQQDADGYFYMTTGAGATWWNVLETVAPLGLMPPSVATAGEATVGGTLSADCVSRMSCVHGKEGNQIRSFEIVLSSGRVWTCHRDAKDPEELALFRAVIGGFGYLGAVTRVTFDLVPARSNPGVRDCPATVFTRSTRRDAAVDWHSLLLSLRNKAQVTRRAFVEARRSRGGLSHPFAASPEWSGLSIASFLNASGMSANLLEQRFTDSRPLRRSPGGVYDKDSTLPGSAALLQSGWPTLVEVALQNGFPAGEFVDELFGWTFFLGNYTKLAQREAQKNGKHINFYQQSFALPAGCDEVHADTRPMRRFIELLEARLHAMDKRPATIDFLYVPPDDFLMSASRNFPSFVVTVSFGDMNQSELPQPMHEFFCALSRDCLTLGGRVHLVKNVIAERSVLRAMHGDAAAEFRALKRHHDVKQLFQNEFFSRIFEA